MVGNTRLKMLPLGRVVIGTVFKIMSYLSFSSTFIDSVSPRLCERRRVQRESKERELSG